MTLNVLVVDAHDGADTMSVLDAAGYDCTLVTTAAAARDELAGSSFYVVVMDHDLPDMCGLLIIDKMQGTPVVIVSASASQLERVVALKFGADDFMVKPVNPDELNQRIQTVLRRGAPYQAAGPGVMRRGAVEVDWPRRRASLDGQDLALTASEYRLLAALAASPPETVTTCDELVTAVWGDTAEIASYRHMVDVHVSRLRHKFRAVRGDDTAEKVLYTVRGQGYALGRG